MTDKELHKLKRSELLELLFCMRDELDKLREENDELRKKLENTAENRELLKKILFAVCSEEREKESGE
ncbi:MAG: hypothetical protein MR434_06275 [Ruminococcus sp.]|nr:hypothetical protein [Ruminococcus sp.]